MPFPKFAKQDEIPEAFRSEYEERNGEWHPKVEDTTGLKNSLEAARRERDEFKTKLGAETEKSAGLQRQLDAQKAAGGDPDAKISELLAKWEKDKAAAVEAATKPLQEQLGQKDGQLRTLLIDDKLREAFIAAGGRPEKADRAIALNKQHFDLIDGNRLVKKDAQGNVLTETVEDHFGKTYKAIDPEFYKGTEAAGGGAGGHQQPGPGAANGLDADPTQWSGEQRAQFIEQNGPEAYRTTLDKHLAAKVTAGAGAK
jgi:hypothetical protein